MSSMDAINSSSAVFGADDDEEQVAPCPITATPAGVPAKPPVSTTKPSKPVPPTPAPSASLADGATAESTHASASQTPPPQPASDKPKPTPSALLKAAKHPVETSEIVSASVSQSAGNERIAKSDKAALPPLEKKPMSPLDGPADDAPGISSSGSSEGTAPPGKHVPPKPLPKKPEADATTQVPKTSAKKPLPAKADRPKADRPMVHEKKPSGGSVPQEMGETDASDAPVVVKPRPKTLKPPPAKKPTTATPSPLPSNPSPTTTSPTVRGTSPVPVPQPKPKPTSRQKQKRDSISTDDSGIETVRPRPQMRPLSGRKARPQSVADMASRIGGAFLLAPPTSLSATNSIVGTPVTEADADADTRVGVDEAVPQLLVSATKTRAKAAGRGRRPPTRNTLRKNAMESVAEREAEQKRADEERKAEEARLKADEERRKATVVPPKPMSRRPVTFMPSSAQAKALVHPPPVAGPRPTAAKKPVQPAPLPHSAALQSTLSVDEERKQLKTDRLQLEEDRKQLEADRKALTEAQTQLDKQRAAFEEERAEWLLQHPSTKDSLDTDELTTSGGFLLVSATDALLTESPS